MNDLFGLASTVSGNVGYGKALFLQEYSINIVKKSMASEVLDVKRMLAMAPDQGQLAAATGKGQYLNVTA